jgi:hypothetical protein
MRAKVKANVTLTQDADGKDKLFSLDDALAELTLDGFQEMAAGTALLTNGVPFTLGFGQLVGSGAQGMFLKGNGDFAMVLNGGSAVQVKRGVVGPAGSNKAASARVLMEAAITSVVITPVADMLLTFVLWGDPVA